MDKAIFQFDSIEYDEEQVKNFNRKMCEKLCNADEDNVTKFDLENESLEELLNANIFDVDNCYYRVFIS